jgi:hypothetical protein
MIIHTYIHTYRASHDQTLVLIDDNTYIHTYIHTYRASHDQTLVLIDDTPSLADVARAVNVAVRYVCMYVYMHV